MHKNHNGLEPGLATPLLASFPGTGDIAELSSKPSGGALALRFATLQAQLAKHGHTPHQSSLGDGPGPIGYLAESWGMALYLPALADAEQFLLQVGGTDHDL